MDIQPRVLMYVGVCVLAYSFGGLTGLGTALIVLSIFGEPL
jgi:uncharacterized membrane protein YczE